MRKPLAERLSYALLLPLLSIALTFQSAVWAQPAPKRIALLVGVGDYGHPQLNLQGPPYDVAAMRDVLVRRWGFKPTDIKTLVDSEASRANILAELAALSGRSGNNDEVVIYFSGHGTSALHAGLGVPLPHGSGAFIPSGFKYEADSLIVGRTDLVPAISALEAGGRRLWVISDSCYSGNQVRSSMLSKPDELPARMIPAVFKDKAAAQRADLALAEKAPQAGPYPYRATAYLSASSEGETAKDIPSAHSGKLGKTPTLDGAPHGAMTDALLRVLEGQIPGDLDGDGVLSLTEVHRATSDFMAQRAYGHTPVRLPSVADDQHALGSRAVLSVKNVALRSKGTASEPLRLRIDSATTEIATAVAGVPDVRLVKAQEPAEIILKAQGGRQAIVAASGDLLAGMPAAETQRVVAQIRQLAWSKRLRTLAEKNRRGALQVDVDPAEQGGNFKPGQLISFVVRPDKSATVVLLNINSEGKVGVLYPYSPSEANPLTAGQAKHIPGTGAQRIKVTEPFGMDMQFVFAFDEPPPGLAGLHHLDDADPDSARLLAFERGLTAMAGKFTFATSNLRTLRP
jgi:hypothetical protein